jgi:hypothetical protein
MAAVMEGAPTSVQDLLRSGRQRALVLTGQLDRNQGLPTFSGRLTFEQFADLTVVHNRKWADEAGESLDIVTQREIIESHVTGLAMFILQGLVAATISRAQESGFPASAVKALEGIQDRVGRSAHYALPPVTLVLPTSPEVTAIEDGGETIAARLLLPAGNLFVVADGQHRREAARKVREFLNEVIANRRTPKSVKFYPAQDAPLSSGDVEAWVMVQETYRAWTMVAYEAHLGLDVTQARQMFTNYNCNVKPVKAATNLEFDQSNPINLWAKTWLTEQLRSASDGKDIFDLRQLSSINGFLFLGKTSIKSAPFSTSTLESKAREFWTTVFQTAEWKRANSLLREIAVLKGLAKAWFYVFIAKRNNRFAKASQLREYIRTTKFDAEWVKAVPGLETHTVPTEDGAHIRFSPAHNDIVARIVADALK